MRNVIRTLHLSVALVAAIFVVILGITGSIMAFEPELDHVLHRSLWHVDPQGQPLSLEQLAAKIQTAYPGEAISQFYVAGATNLAARIVLGGKLLYVNPYTGALTGQGAAGPDLLAQIHQLHLRLNWMSKPALGKSIVSWADIAMLFLLATGLYLWWPLKRFTITWHLSTRRRWLDVHAVTGITVFTFLLLAGLTGALIGFDDLTKDWLYAITSSQPSRPTPHTVTPTAAGMISPDRAMAIARDAIPGATPFMLALPAKPGGTMSIRSHFPEDLTPGGRSRVEIDPYSGEVVFAEGSRSAPGGTRAVILNRAIHTGDVLGMPSKIVMSLASALTVVMAISGLLTWWNRPSAR